RGRRAVPSFPLATFARVGRRLERSRPLPLRLRARAQARRAPARMPRGLAPGPPALARLAAARGRLSHDGRRGGVGRARLPAGGRRGAPSTPPRRERPPPARPTGRPRRAPGVAGATPRERRTECGGSRRGGRGTAARRPARAPPRGPRPRAPRARAVAGGRRVAPRAGGGEGHPGAGDVPRFRPPRLRESRGGVRDRFAAPRRTLAGTGGRGRLARDRKSVV